MSAVFDIAGWPDFTSHLPPPLAPANRAQHAGNEPLRATTSEGKRIKSCLESHKAEGAAVNLLG